MQHPRIIFFIYVVEDDIELLFLLGEQLQSIAHGNVNAILNSSLLEILARFGRVALIAIAVKDFALFADGARPPERGVADGRAHLEHAPRADHSLVLKKHAPYGRAHDRDVPLPGLLLHLAQHSVT